MPELPEVETTLRGIRKILQGALISRLVVRDSRLRWPITDDLARRVEGQEIIALGRRAKYLLLSLPHGSLIWHLGMSGSMRIVDASIALKKHDHVDLVLNSGAILRYNDPRRFGCLLWGGEEVLSHSLLASLGPEPLGAAFNGEFLYQKSRHRRLMIKNFIMDQKTVVGVGNIYASEALFMAGILPTCQAGRVSSQRYHLLATQIKNVLQAAIDKGGTSLRDFTQTDGRPGYFIQQLHVYGKVGEPCLACGELIHKMIIGQRVSYYCRKCQR